MILKSDPTRSVRYRSSMPSCYNDGMAEYLETFVSDGMADETTGDVDAWVHVARIGRHTLTTDSQGFVTHVKHATEAQAIHAFDCAEMEYAERCQQWADEYAADCADTQG